MAQKTFEQSMKQLERIVQELEEGDLPLEKAIKNLKKVSNCQNYALKSWTKLKRKSLFCSKTLKAR